MDGNLSSKGLNDTNATVAGQPQTLRFICFCGIVFVNCVGLFGNLLTLYIFLRPHLRASINILIAGLALADLSFGILSTTTMFPYGLYYYYADLFAFVELQAYSSVYIYPVVMMCRSASVWTLVIITVERFLAVCYPLHASSICTVKFSLVSYISVVIGAILYNTVRFWEFKLVEIRGRFVPMFRLRSDHVYQVVYTLWMYLIFIFAIPFLTLVLLNLKIVFTLRRASRQRSRLSTFSFISGKSYRPKHSTVALPKESLNGSATGEVTFSIGIQDRESRSNDHQHGCSEPPREQKSLLGRKQSRQSRLKSIVTGTRKGSHWVPMEQGRTTEMMLMVILLFICFNSLAFVLSVMEVVMTLNSTFDFRPKAYDLATDFSNLLVALNSAVNFIVYYSYSGTYKNEVRKIIQIVRTGIGCTR